MPKIVIFNLNGESFMSNPLNPDIELIDTEGNYAFYLSNKREIDEFLDNVSKNSFCIHKNIYHLIWDIFFEYGACSMKDGFYRNGECSMSIVATSNLNMWYTLK